MKQTNKSLNSISQFLAAHLNTFDCNMLSVVPLCFCRRWQSNVSVFRWKCSYVWNKLVWIFYVKWSLKHWHRVWTTKSNLFPLYLNWWNFDYRCFCLLFFSICFCCHRWNALNRKKNHRHSSNLKPHQKWNNARRKRNIKKSPSSKKCRFLSLSM